MHNIIEIQCPQEILLGLHLDAEQFASLVRQEAAMALFRDGKLSSGMAARWLGISRAYFLLKAMKEGGASLLENNEDDFDRGAATSCHRLCSTHEFLIPDFR